LKPERLHKILASRGVASRRASEELIAGGHVTVDGRIVTELGTKVSPDADIRVDGRAVREPRNKVYYVLNKPGGCVTTLSDDMGRRSVGDIVKRLKTRVYPVGRLDAETQGLLLLTNDGELTNILTHPRYEVEKTYRVVVRGKISDEAVKRLRDGVFLNEGKVRARVRVIRATREATSLDVTITQGYNRQIRRMLAAVGYQAKRLERTAFGPLSVRGLPRGGFRALTRDELEALMRLAREVSSTAPPRTTRHGAKEDES